MGRRSINTTKSGKYMNPTDQARKEARKRELKKNKKQRMAVRMAVLKGKDPQKLLEEIELLDKQEFDPNQPPRLNERVLKDKRKKLKETLDRVLHMYEKENPEYALELKKTEHEFDRKRAQMQLFCEQVKNAERVDLDQIPMPDDPGTQPGTSQIPLPGDIPLPVPSKPITGILKRPLPDRPARSSIPPRKRKPPGPPLGPPPPLSDSEDEGEHGEDFTLPTLEEAEAMERAPPAKQRKIRFQVDEMNDSGEEEEKDTRPKFKPAVSSLQVKMLKMAGQEIPMVQQPRKPDSDNEEDIDGKDIAPASTLAAAPRLPTEAIPAPSAATAPTSAPPGAPPGPPPGLPPMMFRPPGVRGGPPGAPPRMLPPGPPPGRPPGLPPGPPPGLPPNLRAPPPRLPPGPPGVPPPRMIRPPGAPPGLPPPGMPPPGFPPTSLANPGVLSAPPSIMKPKAEAERKKKNTATIEAKPQIKHTLGDVTRFMPTTLRVKRDGQSKARSGGRSAKSDDQVKVVPGPSQTKDDAYDNFMREMEGLI